MSQVTSDQPSRTRDAGEAGRPPLSIPLPLPIGWIDQDAAKVIRRLHHHQHETYLVGGCVRDLLVGRFPKDFDVATSASPREVKRIFSNCRLIGRRFRLAHVLFRDNIVEVATFRRDPNAEEEEDTEAPSGDDNDLLIRDDNVFGTAEDDAFRRDFTINGLYYDLIGGRIIDYVNGFRDIEARVVRTIGDPRRRFQEDPIRMLRAVKFSASLGFRIDDEAWAAMKEVASDLQKAAIPRVQEELFKMLRSGFALRNFELLTHSGLLRYMLPEHHRLLVAELGSSAPVGDDVPARRSPPPEVGSSDDEVLPAPPAEENDNDADDDAADIHPLPPVRAWLDAIDHIQEPMPNYVYTAVLCLHPAHRRLDPLAEMRPPEQLVELATDWLTEKGASLRLPRRDREHARLAVFGFARLLLRRDQRRVISSLGRKSYFYQTAALHGLYTLADGDQADAFWRLVERAKPAPELQPLFEAIERRWGRPRLGEERPKRRAAPPVEGESSEATPPARRRRRRRRGGGGGGERSGGGEEG